MSNSKEIKELEIIKKNCLDSICRQCKDNCCRDLIVWKTEKTKPSEIEYMLGMGFEIEGTKNNATMYFLKGNCNFYDADNGLCREHDNPQRPKFCDNFPFKICESAIYVDEKCHISKNLDDYLQSDFLHSMFTLAENSGKDLIFGKKKVYKTANP